MRVSIVLTGTLALLAVALICLSNVTGAAILAGLDPLWAVVLFAVVALAILSRR